MDKVKLKLNHTDATLVQDKLEDTLGAYNYGTSLAVNTEPHIKKMFSCLWLEVYLKLKAKTIFKYGKEKTYSLTAAQALALLKLLQSVKPENEYTYATFTDIIATIDQKTAL